MRLRMRDGAHQRRPSQNVLAKMFMLPSLAGLIAFFVVPTADVVRRSVFNDANTSFVGADNYIGIVDNEAFCLAAMNTARFMLVCIPILLALSLAAALLLRSATPLRRFVRSTLLVPLAIPAFTGALLISVIFDSSGLANSLLVTFGLSPIPWLESDAAFWVLVADYLWKNLGYCVILWLAALACIPEELYEAARVDGANRWQCFARVTLPLLVPSFFVVAVLSIINAFKVYREAYLVAGSYPHESMYLIPHLFNNWFADLSFGKLAAASTVLLAVLTAVVSVLFFVWRKSGAQK